MYYRDAWGKSIPLSKINQYYALGWMESLSRIHYTILKDKITIEKRILQEKQAIDITKKSKLEKEQV